MFAISIKRKALRKLAELTPKQRQHIQQIVLILKSDPIPYRKADVCKLQGHESTYRIRAGDQRIVYHVSWNERTILISYIGPREKAYE